MKNLCVALLCAVLIAATAEAATLREQLALAQTASDTQSQIELIRRILDQEPGAADLHAELCDLWLQIEDYDMAEQTVKEWKDAPPAVAASVLAKVLYLRDKKRQEAVDLLTAYHQKNPGDVEITRQLAGYLFEMDQNQKLVDLLQPVTNDANLMALRALGKANVHDFDGAVADFEAARALDPDDPRVTNNPSFFDRIKFASQYLHEADAALAQNPDNFPALLSRAYWRLFVYFETPGAVKDAEAAHKLQPEFTSATILLAIASVRNGDLPAAKAVEKYSVNGSAAIPTLQMLQIIVNLDANVAAGPKDANRYFLRSGALNDSPEQYHLALADADTALKLDPTLAGAEVERIYALLKLSRLPDAEGEFAKLTADKPSAKDKATAAGYLADAFFTASRFDAALNYANQATAGDPQAKYYRQRAAVYQKLNRPAEATADLAKAKNLETKASR